jgi:acyl-CoA reductase-like NAD-dependent aldehyde dehydrogenase
MSRSQGARVDDVRSLLRAARKIVEDRAAIVPAIAESTGLSAEGVELALTRHLELDATDEDLTRLVERAGDAPGVVVILSANVFVGALRAVALARAAAEDVVVRPSRRDPTFARALVAAAGDPRLRLVDEVDVAAIETGEIHVYGRDDTIADVRARAGVAVRGHGSGMGVAWVSSSATVELAAQGLADDVVVFDQRGCLSPRVAFVEGDEARAGIFAEALHEALERLDASIPRGDLPAEERAASDRYVATMTYACRARVGQDHAIGVAAEGAPLILPPPYRHVHVVACKSIDGARFALAPLERGVIAVGSDDPAAARALGPPWARCAPLGEMQRPPLDGPVDLRSC